MPANTKVTAWWDLGNYYCAYPLLTVSGGSISTFEGTLEQMEKEARRSRGAEKEELDILTLEMRLAALAARMASPRRGDRPDQLNAEYEALADKIRERKH